MTVTLQNVDLQFLEVLKSLVKMRSDVKISQDDAVEDEPKAELWSERLKALKEEYADLFNDPVEAELLDHVFDDVQNPNEKLRGTALANKESVSRLIHMCDTK